MEKILVSNKLIAEFMGWEPSVIEGEGGINLMYLPDDSKQHVFQCEQQDIAGMKYQSDWNLLIEVIEKCREKQIFGSQRLINNIDKRLLKLDLIATYRNVVDFIEWYNLNKQES